MAVRTTQVVAEVIIPTISRSPTTPTGVGVTQATAEVVVGRSDSAVRVANVKLEVIVGSLAGGETGEPGDSVPVTTVFGHAG